MNILHIADINYNLNEGVRTVVESLIKVQKDLGQNVSMLNVTKNSVKNDDELKCDCGYEFAIDRFSPDIVILHSIYSFHYVKIAKILKKKEIPYLVQLHGAGNYLAQRRKWWKKIIFNAIWGRKIISNAAGVIYLNTQEMDGDVAYTKVRKKAIIIPNGIFQHDKITSQTNNNNIIRFCFLSRVDVFNKGLDVLLEGWNKFYINSDHNYELRIYGSIAKARDKRHFNNILKKYGLGVNYYGQVSGEEKKMAYMSSDIFVLPSRFEGMPMSVLEALSYGLPCIVTRETNFLDIIEDNHCGWGVELTAESVRAMLEIASTEYKTNRNTLKERSIIASQKYTWDKIGMLSLKSYDSILNEINSR